MKVYNQQPDEKLSMEILNHLTKIRKDKSFSAKEYVSQKGKLLNQYMKKSGLNTCVVAISGGVDSAVVLAILEYAMRMNSSPIKKIMPLLLPISGSSGVTNQDDATKRGIELCEALHIKPYIIDLTNINVVVRNSVESVEEMCGGNWAVGQLGPYTRTPVLYYTTSLLNQYGYRPILCGTTNRDEGAYLGYVGKASDGMVDVQVISDIHKSEVYAVANELNVPKSIITVPPSGDMYDNRTDETVFGASYDFVELYLNYLNLEKIEQDKFRESLSEHAKVQFDFFAKNLENLHRYNAHKYIAKSPAVHLDLWDSSVKNGWDNYYAVTKQWMSDDKK